MDPKTARRLRRLLERKQRTDLDRIKTSDELAVAVLVCHEQEGASVRQIAAALAVPSATVHVWVKRGRRLRS